MRPGSGREQLGVERAPPNDDSVGVFSSAGRRGNDLGQVSSWIKSGLEYELAQVVIVGLHLLENVLPEGRLLTLVHLYAGDEPGVRHGEVQKSSVGGGCGQRDKQKCEGAHAVPLPLLYGA